MSGPFKNGEKSNTVATGESPPASKVTTDPTRSKMARYTRGNRKANIPSRSAKVIFDEERASTVLSEIIAIQLPDSQYHFTHSEFGIIELSKRAAIIAHNNAMPLSLPAVSSDVAITGFSRLGHLLVGKKLAFADDSSSIDYLDQYMPVKMFAFEAPTFLKTCAEGYGAFQHDSRTYVIHESPLEQFNHIGHFIFDKYDDSLFYVNTHISAWKKLLAKRFHRKIRDILSSTYVEGKSQEFNCRIKFPVPDDPSEVTPNWRQFWSSIGTFPVSALPYVKVIELLNLSEKDQAKDKNYIANLKLLLNEVKIELVTLSKQDISTKISEAYNKYVGPLLSMMRLAFHTENVQTFESTGRPWQLVTVCGHNGFSNVSLSDTDRHFASILSAQHSHMANIGKRFEHNILSTETFTVSGKSFQSLKDEFVKLNSRCTK